jgi:membrane associated rhomboid family serine protease
MTSTSVGMRCPECSRQRTKVKGVGSVTEPVLTYVLIGINVAVALGGFMSGASATGGNGIGASSLLADGSVSRFTVDEGDFWRIVTAGFLHSGFLHLLFNMFGLYILGTMLEPAVGRLRFGVIYFVSLLCGSFGALLLEPDAATVGASGAVFGLLGAAIVLSRSRGIDPMANGLMFWLGINVLLSFRPGISLGGHLGGLAGGVLVALLLFALGERGRLPERAALAAAAGVGLLAGAAALAVA